MRSPHSSHTRLVAVLVIGTLMLHPGLAVALAGPISGSVHDAESGAPLAGVTVRVTDGDTGASVDALTTSDGSYTTEPLAADARYSVAFIDTTGVYRDETYGNRGLPIGYAFYRLLVEGETLTDVDARLETKTWLISSRVRRIGGVDRYQTALAASRDKFTAAETVVIASGADFPDALAASPLAGVHGGPILLTPPNGLPAGLLDELARLQTRSVIIVGGEGAVSWRVDAALRAAGYAVERIGGLNRYDTAAQVALRVDLLNGGWWIEPYVCRGDDFPDALAASAIAYATNAPILLTRPNALPPETAHAWYLMASPAGNESVNVVGGVGAVSEGVVIDLANTLGVDVWYLRYAGLNRYETALDLASSFGPITDVAGIARGDLFPDALAGGAVSGFDYGPLLLTPPTGLHPAVADYLSQTGPYVVRLRAFGGTGALTEAVVSQTKTALGTHVYDIDEDAAPALPAEQRAPR